MKTFDSNFFRILTDKAKNNARLRQHHNLHASFDDPCQILFNAIDLNSYIRPHRHLTDPKNELLLAIRGTFGLVIFDDIGTIKQTVVLGEVSRYENGITGVEVSASTWHTLIALEPDSILLEVKEGPFDPDQPKDLAAWAPAENSPDAIKYLEELICFFS